MLNTIAKVAIGAGIALIGAAVVVKVTTVKYTTVKTENSTTEQKEDKKLFERIKDAAAQKVIEILGFVAEHYDDIKNVTVVLGVISAGLEIYNAATKAMKMKDLVKKLDDIYDAADVAAHNSYICAAMLNMTTDEVADYQRNHPEYINVVKKVIGA